MIMETNQSLLSKITNIFMAVGLAILIIAINSSILNTLIPMFDMKLGLKNIPWQSVARGLTIAPITEELIFRHLPISLLKDTQLFKDKSMYFVAILGAIFGAIHGGYYNILIQGVAGFAFGWVYVKNGMSYWSAVSAHFLYNFMIYIVFPVITN
jgi:membrane protease YdiL (CAAX protease family)